MTQLLANAATRGYRRSVRQTAMRFELFPVESGYMIVLAMLPTFRQRWVGLYENQHDAIAHARDTGLLHPTDVEELSATILNDPFLNEPVLVPKRVLAQFVPFEIPAYN